MSDDMNGANYGGPGGAAGPGGPGSLPAKQLERKLEGRWVAGVCAGLADYSGLDVSLIRVIFAVLTLFGGVGAIAYVLAWALVPEQGEPVSIAEKFINKSGT
jgi:phage shock protein C